jgi:hypothetical protein
MANKFDVTVAEDGDRPITHVYGLPEHLTWNALACDDKKDEYYLVYSSRNSSFLENRGLLIGKRGRMEDVQVREIQRNFCSPILAVRYVFHNRKTVLVFPNFEEDAWVKTGVKKRINLRSLYLDKQFE